MPLSVHLSEILNFVAMIEKWGHLCSNDTFLVLPVYAYMTFQFYIFQGVLLLSLSQGTIADDLIPTVPHNLPPVFQDFLLK